MGCSIRRAHAHLDLGCVYLCIPVTLRVNRATYEPNWWCGPPNGWCDHRTWLFANRTDSEQDCSSTVRSPHMAVCSPNGLCSNCMGLFAHRTGGAVTARVCSPTERVVKPPNGTVRPPNGWCVHCNMANSLVQWPHHPRLVAALPVGWVNSPVR